MLKLFKVQNFKNFNKECVVDFTKTREYEFNKNCIKDGLVNKALLYGANGSGKTNLGLAFADISVHLSDNRRNMRHYDYSLNGDTAMTYISFEYVFDFKGEEVIYRYKKSEIMELLEEQIMQKGEVVFEYDYKTNKFNSTLPEIENFNTSLLIGRNLSNSVIKTIYGYSSTLPDNSPIKNIYEFANNILWFRSVVEGIQFMGSISQGENIEQFIIGLGEKGIKEFSAFLSECGLQYQKLEVQTIGQSQHIVASFKNKKYPLVSLASTGTKALWVFYYWMKRCENNISFLYLDEFDAFYHTKLAKKILEMVLHNENYQAIVTTHNSYLADNSILRPDCYWILKEGEVKSFADRTSKTIRESHNLEKMLMSNEFE
ncbi:MAG: ATP-binding protein [Bacilli bacterium]|jgi:hypothetical protein